MTNQEFLARLGVSRTTWYELRRICRRLHKLDEMACNGEIQDPNDTDTWYRYQPIDLVRLAADLVKRHGLSVYHQGDPRGCSLYVYKQEDLERCSRGSEPGYGISAYYNTIGTAIC